MGILRNGILGGFEKRTGGVIGRVYKGKNVVSALPHNSMYQVLTELQRRQRMSFKMVSEFLACFINLIRIGFGTHKKLFPMNLAMRQNFKQIVAGSYPDFSIRYERVMFSMGSLNGPDSPSVAVSAGGLLFSWACLAQSRFCEYSDRGCFLVYCPAQKNAATAAYAAKRIDGNYFLELPSAFAGEELHCYMSFVAEKGKVVSDSVYLGAVQDDSADLGAIQS